MVVGMGAEGTAALIPAQSSNICAVQGCWEGEGVIHDPVLACGGTNEKLSHAFY